MSFHVRFSFQLKTTLLILTTVGLLCRSTPAFAQTLYNDSLGVNTYGNLSVNDAGATFRGGANFQPFVSGKRSAALFQGGVSSGGMCNFDLVAGFKEEFKELPGLIVQVVSPNYAL